MPVAIMPAEHARGIVSALGVTDYAYVGNALHVHDPDVTQDDLDTAVANYSHLSAVKAEVIAGIKRAAYVHIVSAVPEWQQRNHTARGVKMLRKIAAGTATEDEIAFADYVEAIFDWVDEVRTYSDGLESSVVAASTEASARAVLSGATWPAYDVEAP